jgi:hypothetical protein
MENINQNEEALKAEAIKNLTADLSPVEETKQEKKNAYDDANARIEEASMIDPLGYIELKKSDLSYNGDLYGADTRISVLPVKAGLLKYFATLDETNPMSVQDALIYVLKNHVRVIRGKKVLDAADTIYEHDRLLMTMFVHQYSGSPTNLVIKAKTPSKQEQDVIVTPKSLLFSELTEKGKSYLNAKTGQFEIKTKSFGTIIYKPLTANQSIKLTEYVYRQQQEGETIEPFFIQVAPFFINEANANDPKKIYGEYFKATQDMKYISVLLKALEHVNVELLLEFSAIDEKTKEPFRAPVTSLRGIKDIFTFSDSESELQ